MSNHTYPHTTSVVIDCDPFTGMGRQQDHFDHIWCTILGRPKESEPKRVSACFGAWTWDNITYNSQEEKDAVGNFLKSLYNQGKVRYAEW